MLTGWLFLSLLFIFSLLYLISSFSWKTVASWIQSQALFVGRPPVAVPQSVVSDEKKEGKLRVKADDQLMKSVFGTFDANKDGYITRQELKESLSKIGMPLGESDVAEMVSRADFNGDGLIDLEEFSELYGSVLVGDHHGDDNSVGGGGEADLREAFGVFDEDRDGMITVEELGMVLSSLGFKEGKRLEDCREMIRRIDLDGDGMVSFDEFKFMMQSGSTLLPP